jgi:hypothetical protein
LDSYNCEVDPGGGTTSVGFGVLQKTQRKEVNSKWCRKAA